MASGGRLNSEISRLLSAYSKLSNLDDQAEKRTEEFLRPVFEALDWKWLSNEVTPQKRIRSGGRTTRVDYAFRKTGELRTSFYLEVKRFSNALDDAADIKQALEYGKNSGSRWVVLSNFNRWRVFNSDYFDEPEHAELFEIKNLSDCLTNPESMQWLSLFSHDNGGQALDDYAKKHKKWKESDSVEDLLTEQLIETREKLSKAVRDQNYNLFDTTVESEDVSLDACVQHILDRIIFCRMIEDNGADPDLRLRGVIESWEPDKRSQLYRAHLCPLWAKMRDKYDSTIFDNHRIDGLTIKNEDFVPVLESFYVNPKTKLRYRFEAIGTDILGHAYENYLSYKIKQTAKRTGLEKEIYKRKQGGIYYTPEFLVDYLVKSTLGEKLKKCRTPDEVLKIRVLDPACGSGTFLVRAFEEFKAWFANHGRRNGRDELAQTRLDSESENGSSNYLSHVLENCLYGIDIDPRAVRLAKLNLFLRAIDTPKQLPRLNIIERNSLIWDADIPKSFRIERDFPLVHEQGGFDVVLGNPPWEKWKPDSQEFFEEYEPGFKSLPAQEAKKRMEEILKTRIGIKKQWEDKLREYGLYSEIYRANYKYQSTDANGKSVSGDLDLYKLFTERFHQLLKDSGLAGIVVPSGIYTDLGAKGLRTMLFEKSKLLGLFAFENRKFIFPDIDQRYKFALLTFHKGGKTKSFPCAFFLHTHDDLEEAIKNPTMMDVEFIKKSSPTSWGLLEIKTKKDYEIVGKLLKYPSLGEEIEESWNIELSRGFDMTNDSHLFKDGTLTGVPMLEGKNIEQFTHKWKEAPIPRYKVLESDWLESSKVPDYKNYWLGFRRIANSTNYRTLITTIIPPGYCCAESITFNANKFDYGVLCYLCGVLNSFTLDYFIRQKVSANINMFHFLELPVPRLSSGKEFDFIAKKTAQLVCTTDEFKELRKTLGIQPVMTENDRALARAQLDAMVAKLYGLTKEELAYILTKFPLVEQKQKDLVLGQY